MPYNYVYFYTVLPTGIKNKWVEEQQMSWLVYGNVIVVTDFSNKMWLVIYHTH